MYLLERAGLALGGGLLYPFAFEELGVADLLGTWLDKDRQAKFLIDDQLHVLWQSQAGSQWLRDRHAPLKLVAGRLVANDSSLQARLAANVEQCRTGDDSLGSTAVIKEPGAQHDWLLCVQHIGLLGSHSVFELSVRYLYPHCVHDLVGLREAFELTAAEDSVLRRMTKGMTVEVIAMATGSSPETVRTHVRRAYSKLGVSSREEMFSRIRPFLFARHEVPAAH